MWTTFTVVTLFLSSVTWAHAHFCKDVLSDCLQTGDPWTRCYEDKIGSCTPKGRRDFNFFRNDMMSSQEAEVSLVRHSVRVPSAALKKSRGMSSEENVLLVVTVLSSSLFQPSSSSGRGRSRMITPTRPPHRSGFILGETVLLVRAGNVPVTDLSQPVKLIFKHNEMVPNGVCVFWQESDLADVTGNWSTEGCVTTTSGTNYICSCNHLSFFAVLVNPILSVDKRNAVNLSYINYIGSAFSVFFTVVSLVIYIFLQRQRPEKAIGVHIQLTLALLCLHLSYLLCSLIESDEGWVCQALGFLLHWSLLASFSWMTLEGFHLYLLLVRVFNIYVRRYLLKLSLVGWGLPTLVATICGISRVYGKNFLKLSDDNSTSRADLIGEMCWISSQFPQRLIVVFITTVAFPCLVIIYNSCMLGRVVFQLWVLRKSDGGFEGSGDWKTTDRQKMSRLWKDCMTVVGLSCLLGLPWGLATSTYNNFLPGLYIFTVLNSLQGVFMFLWCLALSCKSRSDQNSSVRDPSSQKMVETSFNN